MTFSVRFWGVRGSIACSGPRTARYGGNTSSLEVRCGGRMLLFDGGTGLRYLGNSLVDSGQLDVDLFLTHTHFDHVCGLPFFKPFFQPQNRFRLWAGHLAEGMTLRRVLGEFMMAPLFPVPPQVFRARMEYREFKAGETLRPADGVAVRTATLNHPDGATGYRVEYGGRSVCYLTDTEHVSGAPLPARSNVPSRRTWRTRHRGTCCRRSRDPRRRSARGCCGRARPGRARCR